MNFNIFEVYAEGLSSLSVLPYLVDTCTTLKQADKLCLKYNLTWSSDKRYVELAKSKNIPCTSISSIVGYVISEKGELTTKEAVSLFKKQIKLILEK